MEQDRLAKSDQINKSTNLNNGILITIGHAYTNRSVETGHARIMSYVTKSLAKR